MSDKACLVNLPEPILHRILEFLAPQVVAHPGPNGELQTTGPEYSLCQNALDALSKTSKSGRRLSLSYLYRNPVFVGPRVGLRHIQRFAEVLLQHPRRGSWVRKLMWQLPYPDREGEGDPFSLMHPERGWVHQVEEMRRLTLRLPSDQSPAVRRLTKLNLEANLFPARGLGAIAFPILALTTRLRELVIWDSGHWYQQMPDDAARDPFFLLSSRFKPPRLSRTGRAIGPTFPPPELETMSLYELGNSDIHDKENDGRVVYTATVASISSMRSNFQLSGLLNEMDNKLDTSRNHQTLPVNPTHFQPSRILKASAESYLHIRSALEKARNLPLCLDGERSNTNWRLHIDWLQELPGNKTERKMFASDLDDLDERNETFSRTITRCQRNIRDKIPIVSGVSLHYPLAWLISEAWARPGDRPDWNQPLWKLRILHPHHARPARYLQGTDVNFGQYLQRGMSDVPCLAVPLQLRPADRQQIYGSLDTSELKFVTELEITVEGLWGPMTTAMRMLEKYEDCVTCSLDRCGKCLKHLDLQQLRAMRRKAINRLPPNLVTLRLVDWFAEYHDVSTNLERHEARHQQADPATANDDQDDNDDDEDMNEDEDVDEDEDMDEDEHNKYFIDDNGTLFDPRADHSTYFYPQDTFTFPGAEQGNQPNRELWKQAHFMDSLTRRYIRALEHGLVQPFPSSSEERPTSFRQRRSLRRIEFVYTPLRQADTGDAWVTYHVWRTWYASLEYQTLVEKLGKAGMEFVFTIKVFRKQCAKTVELTASKPSLPGSGTYTAVIEHLFQFLLSSSRQDPHPILQARFKPPLARSSAMFSPRNHYLTEGEEGQPSPLSPPKTAHGGGSTRRLIQQRVIPAACHQKSSILVALPERTEGPKKQRVEDEGQTSQGAEASNDKRLIEASNDKRLIEVAWPDNSWDSRSRVCRGRGANIARSRGQQWLQSVQRLAQG
ncbi:hypothetical protein QBC37DRAFT_397194 [Rhypophila decipiens]|uniref:Uncharacterized protein n=1 Tax=Rhypophila decipiens TaxID=261697 RepID=A0AAN6YDX1_9PEZI|nr:hypothetical protein QBC37DRAFT_397194 [Rhypophila decipiens]